MKKGMKWLVSLLTALLLVGTIVSPVSAQVSVEELLTKTAEAQKDVQSMHLSGTMSAAIAQGDDFSEIGQMALDMKFNLTDVPSGQFKLDIVSMFLGSEPLKLEAYVKDNKLLFISPGSSEIKEITEEQMKEFNISMEKYKQEANSTPIDAINAKMAKYFEVKETDDAYVLTFKEDIDMQAFWNDALDPETVKMIKEEVVKQAETSGQPMNEEAKQTLDKVYSPEFLGKVISERPVFEAHYAKDTFYLKKSVMEVLVNVKEAAQALATDATESLGSIPNVFKIKLDFTMDEHGVMQEIVFPEVKEESSMEPVSESMEESSSSAE
ncbi:hypothetical protein NHG25_02220 [Aerococcaceae bacterium NML191292]|nr:hypothetical protein [Aerococcaceae bacterium NML191292]